MNQTAPRPSDQTNVLHDDVPAHGGRRLFLRCLALVGAALFIAFWTWALFFSSKEAINRIEDRAWAERAESICAAATIERMALSDFRELDEAGPELIAERAQVIDRATDILEGMLNDVVAVAPTDPKGIEIVPLWEADYRIFIEDRRSYANELRAAGKNLPFYETAITIPISEKVATFAGDNSMPSCSPPSDLSS